MVPALTAAVVILAIAVIVNMLLTFAMIRRLRASELAAKQDAEAFRPSVGSPVGEFSATATDGSAWDSRALGIGTHTVAFLLPNCGGCTSLVNRLTPAHQPDRSIVVVVSGSADDPATVAVVQAIPGDLKVVIAQLGGDVGQAFKVATFPTIVQVVEGRIAAVGETFDELPVAVGVG
ncbi:hypothetical protein [Allorhizocola rhizosphaerae]|uniref:hypothetical protein n=1 Tax=Allorhizocola rhizosphaerae TaxID=1872709 RepID=UPI000E3CEED1|nr:hypothetical protein [Allorhizocola rhizosphaerae]